MVGTGAGSSSLQHAIAVDESLQPRNELSFRNFSGTPTRSRRASAPRLHRQLRHQGESSTPQPSCVIPSRRDRRRSSSIRRCGGCARRPVSDRNPPDRSVRTAWVDWTAVGRGGVSQKICDTQRERHLQACSVDDLARGESAYAVGRVSENVEPTPSSLSAERLPPMPRASSRLMARPRPTPWSLAEVTWRSTCTKGSNTCSR